MKENFNKGYQLPAELVRVMDLASELNARACEVALSEQNRLVKEGWYTATDVRDAMSDMLLALDHTDLVLQNLSEYASMLIKTEATEKSK